LSVYHNQAIFGVQRTDNINISITFLFLNGKYLNISSNHPKLCVNIHSPHHYDIPFKWILVIQN